MRAKRIERTTAIAFVSDSDMSLIHSRSANRDHNDRLDQPLQRLAPSKGLDARASIPLRVPAILRLIRLDERFARLRAAELSNPILRRAEFAADHQI